MVTIYVSGKRESISLLLRGGGQANYFGLGNSPLDRWWVLKLKSGRASGRKTLDNETSKAENTRQLCLVLYCFLYIFLSLIIFHKSLSKIVLPLVSFLEITWGWKCLTADAVQNRVKRKSNAFWVGRANGRATSATATQINWEML